MQYKEKTMTDSARNLHAFIALTYVIPKALSAAVNGSEKKIGSTFSTMSPETSKKFRLFSIGIRARFAPLSIATCRGSVKLRRPSPFFWRLDFGSLLSAPAVVSVTPVNGATSVATNSAIVVQFSNPMNPISFNTTSFALTVISTSAVVPGTFSLSADAKTVTFTPTSNLMSGSVQYTLTISYSGLLDVAGNALSTTFTSFFQTQ